MCAARSIGNGHGGGGLAPGVDITRWVGRYRPSPFVPANDNRRSSGVGHDMLAATVGWRTMLGVGGLGLAAAFAGLLVLATSHG